MTTITLRAAGRLAEADIEDHKAGRCQIPQFVLAACRTYYLARASDQDAEGYRTAIENYLGFPLPLREDLTLEQWTVFVGARKQLASQSAGHAPIYN